MAKWDRKEIGHIAAPKIEGDPCYIKITEDIVLKKGDYINLETMQYRLEQLDKRVEAGYVSAEDAEVKRENIKKMPTWKKSALIKLTKLED